MTNKSHLELLLYAIQSEDGVSDTELAEPERFRVEQLEIKGYLIKCDDSSKGRNYKLTKDGQRIVLDVDTYIKAKYGISAVAGIMFGME